MKAGTLTHQALYEGTPDTLRTFLYANRRRANAIRLMDTDWPQAEELRKLLVDYAGIGLTIGTNSSALCAIDRGALAYEKTLGQKPDWRRLSRFLDTAIQSLAVDLAGVRVRTSDGEEWKPEFGGTLTAWMKPRESAELTREKVTTGEIERIKLALMAYLHDQLPEKVRYRSNA